MTPPDAAPEAAQADTQAQGTEAREARLPEPQAAPTEAQGPDALDLTPVAPAAVQQEAGAPQEEAAAEPEITAPAPRRPQ